MATKNKEILITGGTGFIGYNIVNLLLKKGYNIRLFVRNLKFDLYNNIQVEIYRGDITNYDDIYNAMCGCDTVIHCAGLFTFNPRLKKEIFDVNVNGTENVCKAAISLNIDRLIYTSSAATIGKSIYGLSDESTDFNLWNISSYYKKSKVLAENVVYDYIEKFNLPAIILNPSLPIGKFDFRPTSTGMMVKSFFNSSKTVFINGGFNFVSVDDVAHAHYLAIEKGVIGQRYIIGNDNVNLQHKN